MGEGFSAKDTFPQSSQSGEAEEYQGLTEPAKTAESYLHPWLHTQLLSCIQPSYVDTQEHTAYYSMLFSISLYYLPLFCTWHRAQILTLSCLKKQSILSSLKTRLQDTRFWKTLGIFFRATLLPSRGSVTDLGEEVFTVILQCS